ncbi:acyl carrier protein [Candidatus Mycobacterium wuenschmannii]|uniref:Acyl carrier protein n=1 Tax=Candidatus Mycobacterium wuenschmannii TaxID=3027808 RepID=A0ABY8W303_9MYCO|nr:acyl carrier protein [Candidatus Mycobacterium wuenschmannii]WIM90300.1 acyl carrier protein [Candidatus Mycobacterium wuenschmannii]
MRERIVDAVCEVLYVDEAEFVDGDATDLRDLGLDSVRFVLLMNRLGVEKGSELQRRLADNLSIADWMAELAGRRAHA